MARLGQVGQRVVEAYTARRAAVRQAHDEGFGEGYGAGTAATVE